MMMMMMKTKKQQRRKRTLKRIIERRCILSFLVPLLLLLVLVLLLHHHLLLLLLLLLLPLLLLLLLSFFCHLPPGKAAADWENEPAMWVRVSSPVFGALVFQTMANAAFSAVFRRIPASRRGRAAARGTPVCTAPGQPAIRRPPPLQHLFIINFGPSGPQSTPGWP